MSELWHGIKNMVRRAVLKNADDSKMQQEGAFSALHEDEKDEVEILWPAGLTVVPLPGAETLVLAVGADAAHAVALPPIDRTTRLKPLEPGDAAIYSLKDNHDPENRDSGAIRAVFRGDGRVEILGKNVLIRADEVCRIDADEVEIHARTKRRDDVHGYGSETAHAGGANYTTDSWSIGANVTANPAQAIDQPDIPSEHPDGP